MDNESLIKTIDLIRRKGSMVAIYGYYDMPLTYVKEYQGIMYLFHYIEEKDDCDAWLTIKISSEINEKIYNQQIHPTTLLKSYYSKEKLYYLETSYDNHLKSIKIYNNDLYDELDFPDLDAEFNYDYLTKTKLSISRKASTVLNAFNERISFTFSDKDNSHYMPLNILENITSLVNSLYHSLSDGFLAAEATPRGSFGITVIPYKKDVTEIDIFSYDGLSKLVDIFKAITTSSFDSNLEYIESLVKEDNGVKVVDKVNNLLKFINKNDYTFTVRDQYYEPISNYSHENYYITTSIDSILSSIDEEEIFENIEAKLVSFNSLTGNIKIILEEQIQISGYLESEQFDGKMLITPSPITINYKFNEIKNKFELLLVKDIIYADVSDERAVTNSSIY
ncbi:DUF6575 domain-containing protein [Paenisporosarcina quisquiliarum]|uniref:DUF6575 domain-containing protein n=1 Tax=Paenisporosarcina quisquiliarum TaxID=365346 RepID=UPI0037355B4C